MKAITTVALLGAAMVYGSSGTVYAAQPDVASEVAALRAEVAELRAGQQGTWLNERRAQEVKALVREVMADAGSRPSLAGKGVTAGWNKKFYLASEDGNFLMNIGGRIQFRYLYNQTDGASDEGEGGFQLRRMKFGFEGFIGKPQIGYKFTVAGNRDNTVVYIEDAAISYKFDNGITLTGGRTKAPFLREELTSSGKQLTVERSLLNELFTAGFTEGITVGWSNPFLRLSAMVNDGINSAEGPVVPSSVSINSITVPPGGFTPGSTITPTGTISPTGRADYDKDNTDIAVTARADWRVLGDWKQWDDTSAWTGEEMALFLGAAGHYEVAETGTGGAGSNDSFFLWTVDGSFEWNGLGLFAAVMGSQFIEETPTLTNNNNAQWGVVAQVGYMVIPDKFEPFARYEWFEGDGKASTSSIPGSSTSHGDYSAVTLGANYYIRKHDAKFTFDVVYFLDGSPASSSGLGIHSNSAGTDDQWVARAQFQLQF